MYAVTWLICSRGPKAVCPFKDRTKWRHCFSPVLLSVEGKKGSLFGIGIGQHSGCTVFLELHDLQFKIDPSNPMYIGVNVKSWSKNYCNIY